ncbi:MAG: OmpH family outer membrane protein [Minwuia sp.]|uniref:OmpH family outer membrane protein n=1 Tax=Minwuia sp. TaxID=2493630 RepID=UPI003A84E599
MLRRLCVILIVSAAVLAAAPGASFAQQMPNAVVAVMDSQRILRDAKAGQSVAKQIKAYIDSFQAVVKQEEDGLRERQQDLRKQSAILSPEAMEQRRLELQKSFNDAQRMVQDRRIAIDKTRQQALEVIKAQILEIIEELQKERKFNLVLDRTSYSWVAAELDITQEIVSRLDKRLPSVKVERPEGF